MSGKAAADSSGHSDAPFPSPIPFRFSPRPNTADRIHWRHWGQAAFAEAIHQDKPIFLLITSSWCHWCHLLDEITLSEASIISILNRDYIPIRVDGDLRPDINQRYTQNGWPSVVLLSTEGEILWGGVYVPPRQMLYYLGHVRRYYSEHREEIAEQVRSLHDRRFTQQLTQVLPRHGLRTLLPAERATLVDLPVQASRVLRDLFDADYGGFTIHPHLKFPHTDALELLVLLASQGQTDVMGMIEMVTYSLEQMVDGGLWDKDEGGFFRYSAASDWSMPHTEKMLEENAALLRLILLLAQTEQRIQPDQRQRWHELARQLIRYINTSLWQPKVGVFSGSQSADEEYYEPGQNARSSRQPPPVDTTVYTAWNARMISAYLLSARVLGQPALKAMALRTLDWLCEHMVYRDGSMCHYFLNGYAELPGQLADQMWMARALLDAYEACGQRIYLEIAIALMHTAYQELFDEQAGLFYDFPENPQAEGRLLVRDQPLIENALAAESLLRMAAHSNRQNLHDTGLLVLAGCIEKYRNAGIQGATFASVVAQAIENHWL